MDFSWVSFSTKIYTSELILCSTTYNTHAYFCLSSIRMSCTMKGMLRIGANKYSYLSLGSLSFVLFRGIYYIIPDYYSLSEKLMAALILTEECRAEPIADNNSKTLEYIVPLIIFPPTYSIFTVKTTQVIGNCFYTLLLPFFTVTTFSWTSFASSAFVSAITFKRGWHEALRNVSQDYR